MSVLFTLDVTISSVTVGGVVDWNIIVCNLLQSRKQFWPMLVTDAGIVIVYILAFSNAQPPIVVNVDPLANVTVDRLLQREKAFYPISVIVLGIVILCNPELSKHYVHIFVQPEGIVNDCKFEQP